jgi:tRNA(Met) C34 N-acetyltransferase TmcA
MQVHKDCLKALKESKVAKESLEASLQTQAVVHFHLMILLLRNVVMYRVLAAAVMQLMPLWQEQQQEVMQPLQAMAEQLLSAIKLAAAHRELRNIRELFLLFLWNFLLYI